MNSSSLPIDNNGEPIEQGRRYVLNEIGKKGQTKVEVSYDDSDNKLHARKVSDGTAMWNEDSPVNTAVTWRRVEK